MAREAKNPGKRLHPQVLAYIKAQARLGNRPRDIYAELQSLSRFPPDRLWVELRRRGLENVMVRALQQPSLGVIEQICKKERRALPEGSATPWRWWEDHGPYLDRVLAVSAALSGPFTVDDASWVRRFYEAAPDLPVPVAAGLLRYVRIWDRLRADERDRRLELMGKFLGAGPWRSDEARAEYERRMAGTDHLTLQDGELIHIVYARAELHAGGALLRARATVRRGGPVGTILAQHPSLRDATKREGT